jgi:CubicO group peptidase (beta-lactamase class C family)
MPDPASRAAPCDGVVDPRFGAVREAFRRNFAEDDEVGAAVCVRVDGRTVAELWGGHADAARTRPWRRDTLVDVFSVAKPFAAVLALREAAAGRLDLDAPVARTWPAFAAAGKDGITVRTVLAHRAGLPAVRERLGREALYDWSRMCASLAAQAPWWRPDAHHGYHVNTYGFLAGELVRRASGRDFGARLREALTGPEGADFHVGLPAVEHDRVAEFLVPDRPMDAPEAWAAAFPPTGDPERDTMVWHTYFNPSGISGLGTVNTPSWREAQIPSTNAHATAPGVAALYDALLAGRALPPELLAEATRIHSDGDDRVLSRPSRFGLGFQLHAPHRPLGPNAGAFGHYGYGGSLGFADPEARVAFAYVLTRPGVRWQTSRAQRLVDAVYESLGGPVTPPEAGGPGSAPDSPTR